MGVRDLVSEAMRASIFRVVFTIAAIAISPRVADAIEPAPPLPAYVPPPPAPAVDPATLDITVRAGFGARAGSAPNFPIASRLGGVLGLGLGISPAKRFAVGLLWERSSIGSEHGMGDAADVEVGRSLDLFWAPLRIHLGDLDRFRFVVTIAPGLGVQRADANVLLYPTTGMRPEAYACDVSSGPSFALRASVGAEVKLGGALWATVDAQLDHVHASSDMIDECVPGAGALTIPGLRFGLIYRVDVTRFVR